MMDPLETARPWLVPAGSADASATPLICFPHAGGSAAYFHPWSSALAPDVAVVPVQYPGRHERRTEPLPVDAMALAASVAAAILPVVRERPCAFFGHSMGAVLAYEVSRILARDGLGPAWLFLSGRRSPALDIVDRRHADEDALLAEVRSFSARSAAVLADPELRALYLPIIRSDYALIQEYRHRSGPPLACPMTVIIGDTDPRVGFQEARAWTSLTTGPFELIVRPGGHFYLDSDRDVVLDIVRERTRIGRSPSACS